MRFYCGPTKQERQRNRIRKLRDKLWKLQQWNRWFAWYPVRMNDRQCAWLEYIERRMIGGRVSENFYNIWPGTWVYREDRF